MDIFSRKKDYTPSIILFILIILVMMTSFISLRSNLSLRTIINSKAAEIFLK